MQAQHVVGQCGYCATSQMHWRPKTCFVTAVQHKKSFQSRFVSDSLRCTCLGCGRGGAGPVEVMQDETKWAIPAGGRRGIGAAAPDCHKLSCRVRGLSSIVAPDWPAAAVLSRDRYHEGVGRKWVDLPKQTGVYWRAHGRPGKRGRWHSDEVPLSVSDHNGARQNKMDKDRRTRARRDKTRNDKRRLGGRYKLLQHGKTMEKNP